MRVKKTKKGKICVTLDFQEGSHLSIALSTWMEEEAVKLQSVQLDSQSNVLHHLYCTGIADFYKKHYSKLFSIQFEERLQLNRRDALCLMLFLRDTEFMPFIDLKGSLHQLLS
jgi:hypothetical protein